jgi:hypothetical protein
MAEIIASMPSRMQPSARLRLPSEAQQDRTQVRLSELQSKIIAGAQNVPTKLSRYIERRAGADIAAVRCLSEDHDLDSRKATAVPAVQSLQTCPIPA